VIVPDADWPRNGDIVVGSEIPDVPGEWLRIKTRAIDSASSIHCSQHTIAYMYLMIKGWIRLQNGYYLPMTSDDGKIPFLRKVSTRTTTSNTEMKRIGSGTPLFRRNLPDQDSLTTLLEGHVALSASPTTDSTEMAIEVEESKESVRAAIHMDAMAFGMGCCCLQITFQARDVEESRFMYDQLAVLAPIMMALTASTPILKGRIADTDVRWGVISESVDCRTPAERGRPDPNAPYDDLAGKGQRRIYKSRYDSISTYIYQGVVGEEVNASLKNGLANRVLNTYIDIPVPIDQDVYQHLRSAGVDPALSQHIAHLFIRDPLVIFDGAVEELDDETQIEHFESIQSTNW
jgi:Glutamate-cysteine ligase